MDKSQALQVFWSGFDLPAYDELSVPDKAVFPYITYNVKTDAFENVVSMNASLWYRSMSWRDISKKADEIAEHIVNMFPPTIKIDDGRLYISMGSPFAQRMAEPNDTMVRRILLNINAEYLTAY